MTYNKITFISSCSGVMERYPFLSTVVDSEFPYISSTLTKWKDRIYW